jgi:hypothetical protein
MFSKKLVEAEGCQTWQRSNNNDRNNSDNNNENNCNNRTNNKNRNVTNNRFPLLCDSDLLPCRFLARTDRRAWMGLGVIAHARE